jgi:hypothetical protein
MTANDDPWEIPIEERRERWLPALGWEGFYEVSDLGRVRSLRRQTRTGWRGGQLIKPVVDRRDGYLVVALRRTGRRITRRGHNLVLEAFAGPRPKDRESLHGPGGKLDNRWPENLSYGTHRDNIALDRIRDGTANSGERCGSAKLTWDIVRLIRQRAANGETQDRLAAEYGVAQSTIHCAVAGQTWKEAS